MQVRLFPYSVTSSKAPASQLDNAVASRLLENQAFECLWTAVTPSGSLIQAQRYLALISTKCCTCLLKLHQSLALAQSCASAGEHSASGLALTFHEPAVYAQLPALHVEKIGFSGLQFARQHAEILSNDHTVQFSAAAVPCSFDDMVHNVCNAGIAISGLPPGKVIAPACCRAMPCSFHHRIESRAWTLPALIGDVLLCSDTCRDGPVQALHPDGCSSMLPPQLIDSTQPGMTSASPASWTLTDLAGVSWRSQPCRPCTASAPH